MPVELTADAFVEGLRARRSDIELAKYPRYFPATFATEADDPQRYFVGVRMGEVFALARAYGRLSLDELERLLESPIHEARAGAVRIMADQARARDTTDGERHALAGLYLRRHDRIDDWDLVDLGAWHVVGRDLLERPRDPLDLLAGSSSRWERRTSILATLAFVPRGEIDDAVRLATRLVDDPEDTVQKGVGWVLRAVGDVDRARLDAFLERHAATMSRPTLRAALEHHPADERARWLAHRGPP